MFLVKNSEWVRFTLGNDVANGSIVIESTIYVSVGLSCDYLAK